jgi:hydroxymethylpyrimidine/phosphomethylpyrimidine kinase
MVTMKSNPTTIQKPVVLAIAGSDSGGGAGIQADLKTFSARGVFGTSAITCLTAQNPDSVTRVMPVKADFMREQMLQVSRFFSLGAAKTGMLLSADLIAEVADYLRQHPGLPVVVDPVMVASSGAHLLDPGAVDALRELLLPLATVVTPNLDEAQVLLGTPPPANRSGMSDYAQTLADLLGRPVLLKGGHLKEDVLVDVLAEPGGVTHSFEDTRIENVDTHGSGCTLSAAIAAELAKGATLFDAVISARSYLRRTLSHAVQLGPRSFIHHEAR